MKKISLLSFVCITFILFSFTNVKPHTEVYKVNTELSSLEWFAEKLTGKHHGTIKLSSGVISNDHGKYTGTFDIDMTSIENKDVESEEYKTKLENHLKSADFFDAAKFPQAKFAMTSVTPLAEPLEGLTHAIKGMLTIKDITNEITFNAAVKVEGNQLFSTGTAVVDRSKYEIKYGSKSFFEDIGEKMIYDDFKIKFNIVASK